MALGMPRETIENVVSVVLRVPTLFVINEWYSIDLEKNDVYSSAVDELKAPRWIFNAAYYGVIIASMMFAFLPLQRLVNVYMYIVSGLLLVLSARLSKQYIQHVPDLSKHHDALEETVWLIAARHLMYQVMICTAVSYLLNLTSWKRFIFLAHTLPIMAQVLDISANVTELSQQVASTFMFLIVALFSLTNVMQVIDTFFLGINQAVVMTKMYGTIPFALSIWKVFHLPAQLLIFWWGTFIVKMCTWYSSSKSPELHTFFASFYVTLHSMAEASTFPIGLIAFCVTISYGSHLTLALTKIYLVGWHKYKQDRMSDFGGVTEGITVLLLAAQTGISELKAAERVFVLSIILFIVLSSLIQSMYELLDPILLSLAASLNRNVLSHARSLSLALFVFTFPLMMTYGICQVFTFDQWLLVIVSSDLLTSLQMVGTLVIYGFFMYDSLRKEPWEGIDDAVYYTRATTRTIEFVAAVFVVGYGLRECIAGTWSYINFFVLCIHFYFNVWQRLQEGWKSFLLRKEAVQKVEGLPCATSEQLKALNDVCAICYQDMTSARITKCNHYFHGLCLRKWLYVQDKCPLCHTNITVQISGSSSDGTPPDGDGARMADGIVDGHPGPSDGDQNTEIGPSEEAPLDDQSAGDNMNPSRLKTPSDNTDHGLNL